MQHSVGFNELVGEALCDLAAVLSLNVVSIDFGTYCSLRRLL